MKKIDWRSISIVILIVALVLAVRLRYLTHAQVQQPVAAQIILVFSDPTGQSCSPTQGTVWELQPQGTFYSCQNGSIQLASIPQVNADWNSSSGLSQILNKPSLATVATTGSYNDLSNKPTIPTAPIHGSTGSIGGSLITLGCVNQTPVTVTGATTSMACSMSGAGGTQPANVQPQCFVSSANTVTPQFCTAITLGITPSSQSYNIMVY